MSEVKLIWYEKSEDYRRYAIFEREGKLGITTAVARRLEDPEALEYILAEVTRDWERCEQDLIPCFLGRMGRELEAGRYSMPEELQEWLRALVAVQAL